MVHSTVKKIMPTIGNLLRWGFRFSGMGSIQSSKDGEINASITLMRYFFFIEYFSRVRYNIKEWKKENSYHFQ